MEVKRINFPEIIKDNDEMYMQHLVAVVEAIDELSNLQITRNPKCYNFRIAPSLPKYIEPILKEILKLNNLYGIRLELSKSIKASSTITFSINI